MLSEGDRAVISALQVAPRASWADVGEALGISGVTAARRWKRLSDTGTAWVTASPGMTRRGEQCIAYVEIDCAPARRIEVAHQLAQHELVLTVEITTGSADILLTVGARDLAMLSHYLLDRLGSMPEVTRTRARIATQIYTEGSSWRLTLLGDEALRVLRRAEAELHLKAAALTPSHPIAPDLRKVARLLSVNGRASYADLAAATGMSQTSVRRHVTWLVRSGMLLPRTDLSTELSGSPVQLYLWSAAPVDGLPEVAKVLARMRQVRLVATTSSAPSMVICAWLRTVEEVHRFEQTITRGLPELQIVDRLVVLRTVKRMGRLVDTDGRAVGVVPINVWDISSSWEAPTAPHDAE
jgi:DNA-binding Lrp family transcriptional regulator